MFGKLIGNIIAAPIRVANLPLQVCSKVGDAMTGETDTKPIKERDPFALGELADAVAHIGEEMDG